MAQELEVVNPLHHRPIDEDSAFDPQHPSSEVLPRMLIEPHINKYDLVTSLSLNYAETKNLCENISRICVQRLKNNETWCNIHNAAGLLLGIQSDIRYAF